MRILEKLLSIKNENTHKVLTFLGLKFKFKNNLKFLEQVIADKYSDQNKILKHIEQNSETSLINTRELMSELPKLLETNQEKIFTKLEEQHNTTQAAQNIIINRLDNTDKVNYYYFKTLSENLRLYNYDVERKVLENFNKYYDTTFNIDIYNNLIQNLPEEDVHLIDTLIYRQQHVRNTYGQELNIFSDTEKQEQKILTEDFTKRIIKISKDVYKWDKYLLPINWFEACVFYYKHCLDYVSNLDFIKNKDIIDAGGFIGDSALILSPLTNKKVYSFEPLQQNLDLFKKTLALNKLDNVVLEPYALGDETKNVTYNVNTSSSSIKEFSHAPILEKLTVSMITLDDYVKQNNLDIGLIKTDLEGAERLFLNGAEKTIKAQRPTLLISIYHTPEDFFEIKPLIESWNLGYKFRIIKGTDNSIFLETMLIAEVN